MAKPRPIYVFPVNVPMKLIEAYINAGRNGRTLSKQLDVNVYYISEALRGNEPSSPDIRQKMFYAKHKKGKPRLYLPFEQKTLRSIRRMVREFKQEVYKNVRELFAK